MLKGPFITKCIAFLARGLLNMLFHTYKVQVSGIENLYQSKRLILMLWHNRISITPAILLQFTRDQNFTAFISNSRDGAYLASVVESYSRGRTIRVPHNLKHEALRKVIKQLKQTDDIVIITPDGPRGPKYQVKGGIVLAAKGSHAKVVPMSWRASKYWQLKTWDGMMIPKPFSKVHVSFGAPINLNEEKSENPISILENALSALESN